jgi:acyl-coenzyme A thioesterase PaaI-like protein
VPLGALLEARGEVVKAGRSLVFLRGLMTVEGETVFAFSAVIKKTGKRT